MKALQYFFTNVNLVLPVVAAVVVIVSAIVFICVFRSRHTQMLAGKNEIIMIYPISISQKKLVARSAPVKKKGILMAETEIRDFLDFRNGWI